MTISYTLGIPGTNNNPSNDQPNMQINNDAINQILGVDHIAFNAASGGTHQQVTLSSKNTPGAQVDPQSVIYTANGTASTKAELKFVNQDATFILNVVRAWGFANTAGVISSQSMNVTSVTKASTGIYDIVLNANTVTTSNFGVLVSFNSGSSSVTSSYNITGAGTFRITFRGSGAFNLTDPTNFTFLVLQI